MHAGRVYSTPFSPPGGGSFAGGLNPHDTVASSGQGESVQVLVQVPFGAIPFGLGQSYAGCRFDLFPSRVPFPSALSVLAMVAVCFSLLLTCINSNRYITEYSDLAVVL